MLQKRNDFEIIIELKKEPAHLRKLAARLGLIPSTTMRILKKLREDNIIDFSIEGRNNRYFMKDSTEAEIFLKIAENYALARLIQRPDFRSIANRLLKIAEDKLIVLFGSHAKGTATKDSDIDIYIETDKSGIKKQVEDISSKLSVKIGRFDKNSLLGKEIIKNHIVIQNVDRFYQIIK